MSNAPYRDLVVQALAIAPSEARLCRASVAATKIVAFQSNDLITQGITVARYVLESSALPAVQQALPIAEKVRRALIRNRVDTSHSEVITGKTKEGVPLQGHRHAHYFVTDVQFLALHRLALRRLFACSLCVAQRQFPGS